MVMEMEKPTWKVPLCQAWPRPLPRAGEYLQVNKITPLSKSQRISSPTIHPRGQDPWVGESWHWSLEESPVDQ
jgi:hypothetical protein